jgi:hypothetical protein
VLCVSPFSMISSLSAYAPLMSLFLPTEGRVKRSRSLTKNNLFDKLSARYRGLLQLYRSLPDQLLSTFSFHNKEEWLVHDVHTWYLNSTMKT